MLIELANEPRIVVAGGPRTGKSTLAVRLSERHGLDYRPADSLIKQLADEHYPERERWSEASRRVSHWFDDPGKWIIEGVAVPRALRKWLARSESLLDAVVVWIPNPIQVRNEGQERMAKGCQTVWREIRPELSERAKRMLVVDDARNL